ncbi:hypothetical protein HPJ92_07380 [Anoxybacillus flavithermus]|uniref:hypothetical protein n=1 Tax=Anoxybacillus flavithermus TaxID=33934 RepID=UPI001867365C|nr:hypothetical protein [Anoxybacillus flavithermus]MBE2932354.1 hypothetical protein [Anoxybacillus flavithermus]
MKNYFFCYDKRLADFIRYEKNIEYITIGQKSDGKYTSVKNGKIFPKITLGWCKNRKNFADIYTRVV